MRRMSAGSRAAMLGVGALAMGALAPVLSPMTATPVAAAEAVIEIAASDASYGHRRVTKIFEPISCPGVPSLGAVDPGTGRVGNLFVSNITAVGICDIDDEYEAWVTFDLTPLNQFPQPVIKGADLRFGESFIHGQPHPNAAIATPGTCVGEVDGAASGNQVDGGWPGVGGSPPRTGPQSWLVTTLVNRWFTGIDENHGFVLRQNPANANCVSSVSDFSLLVTVGFSVRGEIVQRPEGAALDPSVPTRPEGAAVIDAVAGPAGEGTAEPSVRIRAIYTLPDLVVGRLYVKGQDPFGPLTCDEGQNTFVAVVRNTGGGDAGPFKVRLTVSNADDPPAVTVAGLVDREEPAFVEFEPVRLRGGMHAVRATADAQNQVAESDEANNAREATCQV